MSYLQKWESINILYLKRVHVDLLVGPCPSQLKTTSHKKKKKNILLQPCDTYFINLASMEFLNHFLLIFEHHVLLRAI